MRALLNILVFLGALALTAAVVRPLLPAPELDVYSAKLKHLQKAKDHYTAVFIGSSRVYRELVPAVFEEEMAALGREERIFNFGVLGMRVPESTYLLEEYLALEPANLNWIFVELKDFDTNIDSRNFLSDREVHWHSWDQTLLATGAILEKEAPLREKARDLYGHWRHYLYRWAAVGRGRDLLPMLKPDLIYDPDQLSKGLAQRAGWISLEDEVGPTFERRRNEFLNNLPAFHDAVAAMSRKDPFDPGYRAYHRAIVDHTLELMEGSDARLVFVIMPSMSAEKQFVDAHKEGLIPEMVAMNKPRKYVHLYRVEQRFDQAHLTRPASYYFTRKFVEQLAQLMEDDG